MSRTVGRISAPVMALAAMIAVPAAAFEVEVASSRPELVTGGDALIRVRDATSVPKVALRLEAGRTTVHEVSIPVEWKVGPDSPGVLYGMVHGLVDGKNTLVVSAGNEEKALQVVNHKVTHTLFAGPQDKPFLCELQDFMLTPAVVAKLDPWNADCAASPRISYLYRNTKNEWVAFNPRGQRPTDIAMGMTTDGKAFPLIIRQEIGVTNRSAYVINMPHDPAAGPLPSPASRGGSAWNGKLVYNFGAGARGDGHHMGRGLGSLQANRAFMEEGATGTGDYFITHGYAMASGSLNAFGTSTDDIVSAETAAKVKEHFIELFGPPRFTIGQGVSGGSMQQFSIANAYPGILDGIIPHRQYADAITFLQPLIDCELLVNVFKQGTWTRAQMDAVSGKYWGFCVSNAARYPTLRPGNCDTAVLDMIKNHPLVNPEHVRCTFQDDLMQAFGIDPETGNARRPFDNVGVQYGLAALNSGAINFDQFLDINRRIGGHDMDGVIVPQRTVGDPVAIKAAYETGRINLLTGGNRDIPIIMTRFYNDGDAAGRGDPNVDVHDGYHSNIVLARAQKYLGNRNNIVNLFSAQGGAGGAAEGTPYRLMAIEAAQMMDRWLSAIAADTSNRAKAAKVAANKPAGLTDACWTANGGSFHATVETMGKVDKLTDWAACQKVFPTTSEPRMVAGAPMSGDILKCQLKPVAAADYKVAPSAAQLASLREVFPQGVCDWSKPSVGATEVKTWLTFDGDAIYRPL